MMYKHIKTLILNILETEKNGKNASIQSTAVEFEEREKEKKKNASIFIVSVQPT